MDLLIKLGLKIDFSSGTVYLGNNIISINHELENELLGTDVEEQGQFSYSTSNSKTLTWNDEDKTTWNVVACEKHVIPPMSEVLVRGRLNVGTQEVQTVLVEPVELSVHGLRIARVISNVLHGNNKRYVPMKIINFSRENLEIPKNNILGMAETFETKPVVSKNCKMLNLVRDDRPEKNKEIKREIISFE